MHIDLSGVMDMGYRIVYRDGSVIWKKEHLRWTRVVLYGCICFLVFTMLTMHFWPDGKEILLSWLYPGNVEETRTALQHMASRLRAGESMSDAIFVFCQEILSGAQYPG